MTSLSTTASIASSSLTAIQVQLGVASSNIANADTEGYTAKSATQTSSTTAGVGTGVSVNSVVSKVSKLLVSQLSSATSDTAAADRLANYLDQLQTAMGSTTSDDDTGTSLANLIANVESAISNLVNTPESTSLASEVLTSLDELTASITTISDTVQTLRSQADSEIADDVASANALITTIDSLNEQIVAAQARGDSTADLEDARNTAFVQLSEYLDVSAYSGSDGTMKVYTTSGQVLVDSSAHLLSFDESSTVTSNTVNNGTTAGLSGITVNGSDITDSLSSGSLSALVTLRDETLVDAQDMLNELSTKLISSMNAVQPDLLTGTDASNIGVNNTFLQDPSLLLEDSTGTSNITEMANALLDVFQADTSFDAAGNLSGRSSDFASYASEILANVVGSATAASSALETAGNELSTISDTISSLYGVNVDEETARLSELEQLYSVASQILSIIQEMFDDLLAAVQ